ncbi:MAG: hypothetical protein KKB13_11170, partial [Chloroflexi bacterium]|nr:hypothetical protein [Chloroflexota bacterium]
RRPLPRPVALALPPAAALMGGGLWLRHGLTVPLVPAAYFAAVLLGCAAVDLGGAWWRTARRTPWWPPRPPT